MDRKSAPYRTARSPAVPAEFDDIVTWAAWLYYVDELTQNDIAVRLGVSRASVVNYLQEARTKGIVQIRVDPRAVARTRVSRQLADRFGLKAAVVVPDLPGENPDRRVGAAGARVLAEALQAGDTVGIAWGRTLLEAARAASPSDVPGLTIVQVSGSMVGTADFSPELCTSVLANQLGARCVNLHAPAVLSTRSLRDELLAEPALTHQFALIRSAGKIVFGVGEIGPGSTFVETGMMGREALAALVREDRACAVVIGRLIDRRGVPVASELDDRIVGIKLDELLRVPFRLCLAAGPKKRDAIRAALAGAYATHLVTDTQTAEWLLAAP